MESQNLYSNSYFNFHCSHCAFLPALTTTVRKHQQYTIFNGLHCLVCFRDCDPGNSKSSISAQACDATRPECICFQVAAYGIDLSRKSGATENPSRCHQRPPEEGKNCH